MAKTEEADKNEVPIPDSECQARDSLTCDYLWRTSVFHGVGKIGAAPHRALKALWLLFFVAVTCAMTVQLVKLTTTYFSFPVKTTVHLGFSPLVLPAITICNANPVRRSHVRSLSCALQAILKVDKSDASQECVNETVSEFRLFQELCQWYNEDIFCIGDPEDLNLFYWRKKKTQHKIMMEDRSVMRAAGHQIEDLVVNCSFAGRSCFQKNLTVNFKQEWTMEYGNCYTMNTSTMRVFDSGPPSGLDLIMDLQTDELLTSYKTGYGVRVVVHEHDTRPFPSSEGFTLGAGFETNFGIRMDEVIRLGGRYGHCKDDDSGFFDNVHTRYSNTACRMMCLERTELDRCGCTDALRRTATPTEGAKICTEDKDLYCTAEVTKDYMDTLDTGVDLCTCGNPCHELVFRGRYSARKWPAPSHIPILEESVCKQHAGTKQEVDNCVNKKANLSMEERTSSYVRLRLYYETLNYEKITQEPFYDAERFLSDIGGTLGLWIGASLLGLGEGLELLLFSLLSLWRYVRRGLSRSLINTGSHSVALNHGTNHEIAPAAAASSARENSSGGYDLSGVHVMGMEMVTL